MARADGPRPIMTSRRRSSIAGYKISSTPRERRWISSTNKTSPSCRSVNRAAKSPGRESTGPDVIRRPAPISAATMLASEVLPSPGGPRTRGDPRSGGVSSPNRARSRGGAPIRVVDELRQRARSKRHLGASVLFVSDRRHNIASQLLDVDLVATHWRLNNCNAWRSAAPSSSESVVPLRAWRTSWVL